MKRRYLIYAVALVLVLAIGAAAVWALTPLGPAEDAMGALETDDKVEVVETSDAWLFLPAEGEPTGVFVLYPGGRVDVRSYATLARVIALDGTAVAVLKVPLSLPILDRKAAAAIFDDPRFAGVDSWVVGGHSLGGVAAAHFAQANPGSVDGLLLLASYPADDTDLSGSSLEVTDITATEDGVLNRGDWEAGRARLPEDTRYITIDGGNHALFGDYGPQPKDRPATIGPAEQRAAIVAEVELLFERIGGAR